MKARVCVLSLRLLSLSATAMEQPASKSKGSGSTSKKLKVVVFGGHPDDPESGAGGLIATLTHQGHEVILAYGTAYRGDRRFFGRPEASGKWHQLVTAAMVLGVPAFCVGRIVLQEYRSIARRHLRETI